MQLARMTAVLGGVLALGLAASAATAQDTAAAPTTITITLSEFKFAPTEIDLDHGQAYVLHIVNDGKKSHDLRADAFFRSVTLASDSAGAVKNGAVELTEGESADIALTTGKAGTFEMHCDHPLHAVLGMKGTIVVR